MMKEDFYDDDEKEEETDVKATLFTYLIRWPWFIGCTVLCLAAAFFYLQYTTPVYEVSASVLIKDNEKNSAAGNAMGNLEDLGFYSSTSNFDNEVEILHSHTLLYKVVKELNLYVNYAEQGNFKSEERYQKSPVKVWITPEEADRLPKGAQLKLNLTPPHQLQVTVSIGDEEYSKSFAKLPGLLTTPSGTFSFTAADSLPLSRAREITATVASPHAIASGYGANLVIEPTSKTTTIAKLTLKDTSSKRGADFINKLVEVYNRDANDDKNEVGNKTAEFINERIGIINGELGTTEAELETFKRDAGLTDLKSDAQMALTENSAYEQKRVEISTQLRLVQFLAEYANNPDHRYEVLPINVGLTDTGLAELISRYNELLIERKRLLRTSSESNPSVVNLDGSIRAMRSNVQTTISSVQKGLLITQNDLQRQSGKYAGRINNAPGQERQLVSISRQQGVKSGLYLMLLQKREENAITLASTANNARIVDEARPSGSPVSPKTNLVYLVALVLGIVLPIGVIYVLELFKYKIEGHKDVVKLTTLSIVGDVPLMPGKLEIPIVVKENENDLMTEIFRGVRTNVQYLLGGNRKVILITSTTSSEGKTFTSSNLAVSFALLGKKVVIVGLDIRKPALNKAFGIPRRTHGISNYLADPEHTDLLELLQPSGITPNLSVLVSGSIPPNPTELLARESLEQAIELLKAHFDYVVLDTAPVGMVTDTLLIGRVADASIYICRADYTHKADFTLINDLNAEKRLPNLCTLLNGVDLTKRKYGYYYGYGKYGKKYGYGKYGSYGYGDDSTRSSVKK